MREIIFRAKRKGDGKWVYGDLTHVVRITPNGDERCIRVAGYDVDESTIGQFTGMLDSNGEKIFEGDRLLVADCFYAIVRWCDSDFYFGFNYVLSKDSVSGNMYALCHTKDEERNIIGNIYDDL